MPDASRKEGIARGVIQRHSPKRKAMIISKLRLPFAARWGGAVLQPGEYELILLAMGASPIVAIHGEGIAAMMRPTRVDEIGGTYVSTLFLNPSAAAPEVQFLRLVTAGLDLYFQKGKANLAARGVLALPIRENIEPNDLTSQRRYEC
jgi:hypothetical protein